MDKKRLMDVEIADFKRRFFNQFDIEVHITYPTKDIPKGISLKNLENIANNIVKNVFQVPHYNIRTKRRLRELILIRICTFKVATELGYGPSEVGNYFGFDHATVIHSRNKVDKSTTDFDIQMMLNTIRNDCKNKYGNAGDIKSNN